MMMSMCVPYTFATQPDRHAIRQNTANFMLHITPLLILKRRDAYILNIISS